MKPIFAIDVTTDKENEKLNAEEFVKRYTPKELCEELEDRGKVAEDSLLAAELPPVLRILRSIAGIAGGICILAFLMTFSELGFGEAYKKSPLIFYIGVVGVAVFVLLSVLAVRRSASVLSDDKAERIVGDIAKASEKVYLSLGVPSDAPDVDVLFFRYKEKDGKAVPVQPVLTATAYLNLEFRAFFADNSLMLADMEALYEFPVGEKVSLHKVDKKVSVPHWNKKLAYGAEIFRKYGVKKNSLDCIVFDGYYILEIQRGEQSFGLYFPSYELPVLRKLLNLDSESEG